MKDTNYAFCVARIRALENKLLSKADISALINYKDYASAVNYLVGKGYSADTDDTETLIRLEGEKLFYNLKDSVPDKKELDALFLLNDFHNIKAIVKCAVSSEPVEKYLLYPTTIDYTSNKKSVDEPFYFLKDDYRKVALKAYNMALKSHDGKYCDIIVDKAAIDTLSAFSKRKNSGLLGEITAFLADTANIKIALRGAETGQDADYICEAIGECCKIDRDKLINSAISGKDELLGFLDSTIYKDGVTVYNNRPSDFEKWCDDEIVKKAKNAVYTSLGFEPVVAFYYRKNLEIKTVRMILTAIKSDIDKAIIKERVRQLYA